MINKKLAELILPDASVQYAMKAIENSQTKIAIVVDQDGKLLGTVTDGDIRRALIAGASVKTPASSIMNESPDTGLIGQNKNILIEMMNNSKTKQLPILDEMGRVVDVVSLKLLTQTEKRENLVFILAGGLGTRLHPYTENIPKPMLPIGDKPILEHIIENFIEQGFHRFCLAVRYKSEQIMDYFQDGSKWNIDIQYLQEDEPLGTAGALSLIPQQENHPLIVINGDILTKVRYDHLIDYHTHEMADATICTYPHTVDIPFGVIEIEEGLVRSIKEKPSYEFMVSAGIYCLNWNVVEDMKLHSDDRMDMPDLLKLRLGKEKRIKAYPILEYWMDIGIKEQLHQARSDFEDGIN